MRTRNCDLRRGEPLQDLRPEVVLHQAVVPSKGEVRDLGAVADRQRGEVEPDGPTLGSAEQAPVPSGGRSTPNSPSSADTSVGVIVSSLLPSSSSRPSDEVGWSGSDELAGRQDEAPSRGEAEDELGDGAPALGAGDRLDLVEQHGHRAVDGSEHRHELRDDLGTAAPRAEKRQSATACGPQVTKPQHD